MRRRILLVLSIILARPVATDSHKSLAFEWRSPLEGAKFFGGYKLNVTWFTPSRVISPSFRLCYDQGNSSAQCGQSISPNVHVKGKGIYTLSLTIPGLTTPGDFFLQLSDDSGRVFQSPMFSLYPRIDEEVQRPLSVPTSGISASAESDVYSSSTAIINNSSALTNNSTSSTIPSVVATAVGAVRYATTTKPAAAAIAVPIVFVGMTLLGALMLCSSNQRRRLEEERSAEKLGQDPKQNDLERAVEALSRHPSIQGIPATQSSKASVNRAFKSIVRRITTRRNRRVTEYNEPPLPTEPAQIRSIDERRESYYPAQVALEAYFAPSPYIGSSSFPPSPYLQGDRNKSAI